MVERSFAILRTLDWQEAQVVHEEESGLRPVYSASSVSAVSCIPGGIEVFLLAGNRQGGRLIKSARAMAS